MDWSMGGYGFYVWGSYLFTLAAIALEVFALRKRKRACAQNVERDKPHEVSKTNASYVAQAR
jgi:heme exporter protein CcmD